MSVKLLYEHLLEFLSLKGGFTGSSESTLVKMLHCWKSHVAALIHVEMIKCLLYLVLLVCESAQLVYAFVIVSFLFLQFSR